MLHILTSLHHGSTSGVFDWLARGFAMSVGWMIARWVGLPWALAGVVLLVVLYWLRRRRAVRNRPNVHNNV